MLNFDNVLIVNINEHYDPCLVFIVLLCAHFKSYFNSSIIPG